MPDTTISDSYVVRTQANRERWAAENCLRAGYSFYLPEVTKVVRFLKQGRRNREFRNEPLFPGYLFVTVPENGSYYALTRAFGVLGMVLTSGGGPAIMRARELERIRLFEGSDGKIHLPKKGFRHGDTARITAGAYAGFSGLVQGMSPNERVQMLLEYMGRKVPFLVREEDLELVTRAA